MTQHNPQYFDVFIMVDGTTFKLASQEAFDTDDILKMFFQLSHKKIARLKLADGGDLFLPGDKLTQCPVVMTEIAEPLDATDGPVMEPPGFVDEPKQVQQQLFDGETPEAVS